MDTGVGEGIKLGSWVVSEFETKTQSCKSELVGRVAGQSKLSL